MKEKNIIEQLTKSLLKEIGEDPNREGLLKTPSRVTKSWKFFSKGPSPSNSFVWREASMATINLLLE